MMKKYKSFDEAVADIPPYVERQYEKQAKIAEKIQELIQQKRITQKQLAEAVGMSESQVSWILSGEDNLTIKTVAKLETFFGKEILTVAIEEQNKPIIRTATVEYLGHQKLWERVIPQYSGFVQSKRRNRVTIDNTLVTSK